jgi:uridine kinase
MPEPSRAARALPDSAAETLASDALLGKLSAEDRAALTRRLDFVEVPAGEPVIDEADRAEDMFFVLEGEARLRRGHVDLGEAGPRGHFGELALLTGRAGATCVYATTRLRLARLARERYDALAVEEPTLALRLTQALVASVGTRLAAMTDSVGLLLRERGVPRRLDVDVAVAGVRTSVRTGTLLQTVLPAAVDGAPVVAALVGNLAVGLDVPVTSVASIEPLTTAHWEGQRIYRRSLGLVLLEAAARVDPDAVTRLGPSIGYAQRVTRSRREAPAPKDYAPLRNGDPPAAPLDRAAAAAWAEKVQRMMGLLVAIDAPFRHELWTLDEARAHFAEADAPDAALLLRAMRDTTVRLASCGRVYALAMGPLLPSTRLLASFPFRLVPHDHGFLLHYGDEAEDTPSEIAKPSDLTPMAPASRPPTARRPPSPPPALPRRVDGADGVDELWLGALGVTSVGAFNEACVTGSVSQIIRVCEGLHEKRIGQIADIIAERAASARVICIAGPSSSGKTTFIKRLTVQLQVNGIHPVGISLDDYYRDRDATPLDALGRRDFEALEALDIALLDEHLRRLVEGDLVRTARFDFPSGKSVPEGGPLLELRPTDVLLLEGIHGLNPKLLGSLAGEAGVFRIFIQPTAALSFDALSRVNVSDLRLLRRIVRDRHQRGTVAADNIARWPEVRAGEKKHIFPFLDRADVVFDSALVYEPSVIKVFADRYLLEVPEAHPSFVTAHRLRRLIDNFVTIYPDHVPPTSILREFIGGSGFEY